MQMRSRLIVQVKGGALCGHPRPPARIAGFEALQVVGESQDHVTISISIDVRWNLVHCAFLGPTDMLYKSELK